MLTWETEVVTGNLGTENKLNVERDDHERHFVQLTSVPAKKNWNWTSPSALGLELKRSPRRLAGGARPGCLRRRVRHACYISGFALSFGQSDGPIEVGSR